ncbi:exodeoxyribonuclease III [Demequina muriae]|uniref:Exodeoxyribonuclease III n=1 Tax=Demequina muriae TaxID=3051664 RepID=A0ABT8GHQ1_9MICO|nr:exodeoxyribonuclease III [Demequina sp. EGI L300058]MDN4480955.1 exodeoxyribonuclease III [Demequina sp. EGI L300058]
MRIASVNVNGVRAAARKGMGAWLAEGAPDVVSLQEVRAPLDITAPLVGEEWHVVEQACEIKGRAGVAIASRSALTDVLAGVDALGGAMGEPVHTGRWIEATVESPAGPVRVVSTYQHSGTAGTPSMDDKYALLDASTERMGALREQYERVVVMGDINIAHTERDIKNWKGNLKSAGFLPEERAYLDRWVEAGWVDVHRTLAGDREGPYTWWSMRGKAFDNDAGWRIDYQFASPALAAAATDARVDRQASWDARWTDHAPLVVDYAL